MLRVVLDTNVVVSALLHRGPTSQLVTAWQQGKIVLLVSKAVLNEYLRVLAYPKFRLTAEEIRILIEHQFMPFAGPVQVAEVPQVIRADPSDNIILACAVGGRARYLVSGDHHLLDLGAHRGVAIMTPARFLALLNRS